MRSFDPCVLVVSGVLGSLLGLGCTPVDEDVARSEQAIFHGAIETGEPAVVAVHHPRPGATTIRLCTGAVIAPRVVLTAKHCVFDDVGADAWAPVDPSALTVAVGRDVTAEDGIDAEAGVTALDTTDGPYTRDDALSGNDVAILHLDSDLDVAPLPISRVAPSVGAAIRIAGFGLTESDELGVKHSATASISSVGDGVLESEGSAWTCTGDSGGPALDVASGAIVAVTSIGPRGCTTSTSFYTRVDAHFALIDAALGIAPSPPPPAPPPTPGVPPTPTPTPPVPPSAPGPDAGVPPSASPSGRKSDGCTIGSAPGADAQSVPSAIAILSMLGLVALSRRRRPS